MRYSVLTAAAAAFAAAAHAQAPADAWQFYEGDDGLVQAFSMAQDGSQLIMKCDKKGSRSVYAVIVTQERLTPPRNGFLARSVTLRYDEGSLTEDTWRYYEKSVMAVNSARERSLTKFLAGLTGASQLEVRFEPVDRRTPISTKFQVGGAQAAITRVFTSCGDEVPTS
jgi:hypothetical protein